MATFTVDGHTYSLESLTVRNSRKVQLILARVMAPMFDEKPDVAAAIAQLSEQDLDTITNIFGAACTYTEGGDNFRVDKALDAHFRGRPMAYWEWLAECISSEYADFFAKLRSLVSRFRQTQTPTPSQSPRQ